MEKILTSEELREYGVIAMDSSGGHLDFVFRDAQGRISTVDAAGNIVASDTQTAPITAANSSLPSHLTTWMDPKIIDILFSPMKAAEFAGGEVQKGNWTTEILQFVIAEMQGNVAAYADFSQDALSTVNLNFPTRSQFRYETLIQYGELEEQKASLANVSLPAKKAAAAAMELAKFRNASYISGISGAGIYGLLNDPGLSTPITPTTKNSVPTAPWNTVGIQPQELLNDFIKLVGQLIVQSGGNIDENSPFVAALPQQAFNYLAISSQYNEPAISLIRKAYPNMTFVTIPEYLTASGGLLQIMVREYAGQKTVECVYTEMMRVHPLVQEVSSKKQKRSASTAGAIYYMPALSASMLGIL